MELLAEAIEELLEKELFLYKELQTILEKEKLYIVDMDISCLWEIIARKKQIVLQLEPLNKKVINILEQRSVQLNVDKSSLKLSGFIKKLPVSQKIKSKLKIIKLDLETYKKRVSILAAKNKKYIDESLSVMSSILDAIVDTANREQYNHKGLLLENGEKKRLISAEV